MILTGKQIAIKMAQNFAGHDWLTTLAVESGTSRETVEGHLQEDKPPIDEILEAALNMLASGPDMLTAGNTDEDDLQVSGLAGNIGMLRRN
jgi:hypothetical protein